jgi:hypothetical protein
MKTLLRGGTVLTLDHSDRILIGEDVLIDYAHFRPPQERVAPPEAGARTIGPLAGALRRGTRSRRYCLVTTA